jgi:hypothetical protein
MQGHVNRHKAIKQALLEYLLEIAKQHGVVLDETQQIKVFKGDLEICAQGLGVSTGFFIPNTYVVSSMTRGVNEF